MIDAEDRERIEVLDLDMVRRRLDALVGLPMPRASAEYRFVRLAWSRPVFELTAEDRYLVAQLSWAWRKRHMPTVLVPDVNPCDPLSPERLAMEHDTTPTLAAAYAEQRRAACP